MPDAGQVVSNSDGRNGADAPAGLEGVVVAHTQIGDVRGLEGFYHYRQYDAIELNRRRTLEDVWHLLFRGHLPDGAGAGELPAARYPAIACCRTAWFRFCARWPPPIRSSR